MKAAQNADAVTVSRETLDDIVHRIAQARETLAVFRDACSTANYEPASIESGLEVVIEHLRQTSVDVHAAIETVRS